MIFVTADTNFSRFLYLDTLKSCFWEDLWLRRIVVSCVTLYNLTLSLSAKIKFYNRETVNVALRYKLVIKVLKIQFAIMKSQYLLTHIKIYATDNFASIKTTPVTLRVNCSVSLNSILKKQ